MRFPVSKFTVSGNSMFPTLKKGQEIVSFNWAYLGRKPKKDEIIVIKYQGLEMVKRVEKVEGEQVFVEGDNKEESTDSRDFGSIGLDQVVGKVVYGPDDIS